MSQILAAILNVYFQRDPAGISRVSWHFSFQHKLKYEIPKVCAFIINLHTGEHISTIIILCKFTGQQRTLTLSNLSFSWVVEEEITLTNEIYPCPAHRYHHISCHREHHWPLACILPMFSHWLIYDVYNLCFEVFFSTYFVSSLSDSSNTVQVSDWLFLEWKKSKFTGTMTQFSKA